MAKKKIINIEIQLSIGYLKELQKKIDESINTYQIDDHYWSHSDEDYITLNFEDSTGKTNYTFDNTDILGEQAILTFNTRESIDL